MRAATAGQLTRLRSTDCAYAVRVRIADATGTREWTNYAATNWLFDLEITRALDTPAATLALTLAGGEPGQLASPFVTASSVNASGAALVPGRAVTVEVQSLAPGAAPVAGDWVMLFDGTVDELAITPGRIALQARDRFALLLDTLFDAARGTPFAAAPWATQLQAMLDARLGAGVVPLVVPVAPPGTAAEVVVAAGTSLAEALLERVRQVGWRLVYGWAGNTPALQLVEPRRSLASADWALDASDVLSLREVGWSRERVRNAVTVYYLDAGLGAISSVTEEDGVSIATFGRRPMVIREGATPGIRTSAAAGVMARAIRDDLKDAPLTYELETRALWPVEVGDLLDIGGLPSVADSVQRLAVQRHALRISAGRGSVTVRSALSLRGRPAAAYDAWYRIGDGQVAPASLDSTSATPSFTSTGAVRINVIGPTDATAVRAAVSTSGPPSGADVDAATGSMSAAASMAALTSAASYAVGTTVYVAVAAYVAGVRGRILQFVIVRDAAAGTVALGPDLEVRLALDSTQGTITYLADGTVELSEDGGAFTAAPASPFTRPRAGQGSDTVRTLTLRASLNGQAISNTVVIPARATVDTDTVAPDLRLLWQPAGAGDPASFTEYTVQATNPKAGGPTPTIVATWAGTAVDRFVPGTGWVAMSSGASLTSGEFIRAERPVNGANPASLTVRATIAGGGAEEISRTIPQRAVTLPPALVARITGSTATTSTVTVEAVPAGGTVRWLGGAFGPVTGPAANTDQPSGTAWTFTRAAFQQGDYTTTFRGTVNGVSDEDTVTITEQGRDTVAILTRARVIAAGATTYTVRVSASAPFGPRSGTLVLTQADGATVTLLGTPQAAGAVLSSAFTITTDETTLDQFIDLVVARPVPGATPGRVAFRVDAAGCTSDSDSVDVAPQNPLAPAVVARPTVTTATQIRYAVSNEPPGGTVRLVTTNATIASGAAAGVDVPSGSEWIFDRPPFGFGPDEAVFSGLVGGVSDTDAVTIEEQGRDTIAILTRARVIAVGATTYTIRVSAAAPFGNRLGSVVVAALTNTTLTQAGNAAPVGSSIAGIVASTDDDAALNFFLDYVATRPAVGAQPARVQFRVDAAGCTSDSDSVDIEPQRPLVPGRLEVIVQGPFGTGGWSVGWRAWDAVGELITNPVHVAHQIVQSPAAGAPVTTTGTPVWSPANNWWITDIGRTAGASVRLDLVVDGLTASGTARTVVSVPIPSYLPIASGGGDAIVSTSVTANGGSSFSAGAVVDSALVGATVRLFADYRYSGGGPDVLGAGTAGIALGEVPSTFTGPNHIVPPSGGEAVYIMRVLFEAYVSGRLVGTAYASGLFYVDTSGS